MFVLLPLIVTGFFATDGNQLVSDASAAAASLSDVSNNQLAICEVGQTMFNTTKHFQKLNPDNISFLNWNIYKGQGANWQQDLAAFARQHDVMTIQEAMLDNELTGLLSAYDFNWEMNAAFYLRGTAAGVMNVATADAVHSCGFKTREPFIQIPKAVLISYYDIHGTASKLLVANVHGINFTLGMKVYRQQLEMLYQAIEHHDGPMIVAGDFNSWNQARMTEVRELINRLTLSEIEYPVNNKTHVFGKAIDHVFYRQLVLVDNKVLPVTSSDHNPISVSFSLQ